MSYNPNFGAPPGMQGQFNFPGAPGTQQQIGPAPGGMTPMSTATPTPPTGPAQAAAAQQGLDPNMVQAILALTGQESQRSDIERQQALADQLRADAKRQVQGKQAGRVYVGPRWWDAAASVADNALAGSIDKKQQQRQAGLDFDAEQARQQWLDSLKGKPKPASGTGGEF